MWWFGNKQGRSSCLTHQLGTSENIAIYHWLWQLSNRCCCSSLVGTTKALSWPAMCFCTKQTSAKPAVHLLHWLAPTTKREDDGGTVCKESRVCQITENSMSPMARIPQFFSQFGGITTSWHGSRLCGPINFLQTPWYAPGYLPTQLRSVPSWIATEQVNSLLQAKSNIVRIYVGVSVQTYILYMYAGLDSRPR